MKSSYVVSQNKSQMGCDSIGSITQKKENEMIIASYERLCQLPSDRKSEASKLFFDTFDLSKILNVLGRDFYYNLNSVAQNLDIKNAFPIRVKNIQTIGMFYHRMYNGGVERVIQLLTPILRNAGYNVVVITNQPETDNDYLLLEGTPRVVLGEPTFEEEGEGRANKWEECIKKHNIDVVIYHAWMDRHLFLDMVAVKKAGAAFIVHCHGAYFTANIDGYNLVNDVSNVYKHADAIVTLSENDSLFWSSYNRNTFTVKNPLTFDPKAMPLSSLSEKNIAWVCRYDLNKNPFDALQIMQMVCKQVPDAVLYMVGGGNDEIGLQLKEYVKELQIEKNVVFTGFVQDVSSYLLKSSVFLFTSNFEGYPMAFCEALSCGLPVVTYELPYISMIDDSNATICVRWKDKEGAADALIDLLTDKNKRQNMGAIARQEAIELAEYDFSGVWQNIFSQVLNALDKTSIIIDEKSFEVNQRTNIFLTNQLCRQIQLEKSKPRHENQDFLDYRKIARWKRWIIYLLADKNTLKSIATYKKQNFFKSLKTHIKSCKVLKTVFRF